MKTKRVRKGERERQKLGTHNGNAISWQKMQFSHARLLFPFLQPTPFPFVYAQFTSRLRVALDNNQLSDFIWL